LAPFRFADLKVGQIVEFDEEEDPRGRGLQAVNITLASSTDV